MKQFNGKMIIMWDNVLQTLKEERIVPRVVIRAIHEPDITLPAKQMGDVRIMYRLGRRTLDILYGEVDNKIHVKSVEIAD